jgi:hypothetical protein
MKVLAQETSASAHFLKSGALSLLIALMPACIPAKAQAVKSSPEIIAVSADGADGAEALTGTNVSSANRPFSRFALGGGVSPLGINLMTATNLNRYMNLRLTGNTFKYTVSNISTNGFNVGAALNLASMGASVDIYPFPNHGLRFSPGLLLYNSNAATATFTVQSGESFTLDDTTYYSSSTNPVTGSGAIGLNSQKPAFTLTTGWGNALRRNGHVSFPLEIGAAFIGTPSLNIILNSGQVCNAQGSNCVNVATDATVQSNLQQQIAKYKNNLSPLKTFPIVSIGVAYSFGIR